MFTTISEDTKKRNLVRNIIAREQEVYSYQVNIDNYTQLLSALPSEWPENLLQYNGATELQGLSDEDAQLVNDLNFRDKIQKLLISEKSEQAKTTHVRNAMIAQFTDQEELRTLINSIIAEI